MPVRPLNLSVTLPQMELTIRHPKLHVDVREALADFGLKPIGRMMRERALGARLHALEAIARTAREGDRMAQVEKSANAIVEIARERTLEAGRKQINVAIAPRHPVVVRLEPGDVDVRVQSGKVKVDSPDRRSGRKVDLSG